MLKKEAMHRLVELTASELEQRCRAEKAEAALRKLTQKVRELEGAIWNLEGHLEGAEAHIGAMELEIERLQQEALPVAAAAPQPAKPANLGDKARAWIAAHPGCGTTRVVRSNGEVHLANERGILLTQLA